MNWRTRFIAWLDHRTGIAGAVRSFLYEEIPASSGWHQVFGSVALFLFLVQAFTGALLAFNYAPTPGEAYNSLRYILIEVTNGRLIRGLHHWGASMMIVMVVLHGAQVFLYGAYKKPREGTWILGVLLLLLTLAYGLTGYLLPWDNRAYWGTVVTTQIASKAPMVGVHISRLLGSEDAVGVVTFARFYSLHVLLLPQATTLLILLHVYLVRKHGVAPAPGDDLRPHKRFFPEQAFRDTVSIFIAFAILFLLALFARVPLEQLADPTDTNYIPRPEWYFLFLFQTLKLFNGPLEIIGSMVLPGLAVVGLILTPFVDRTQVRRATHRTFAAGVLGLIAIGWAGLTATAIATTPKTAVASQVDFSHPTDWLQLSPVELAGIGYFREENCAACHTVRDRNNSIGPDLANIAIRKSAAWMIQHFKEPSTRVPGSFMPAIQLSDAQLNTLAAFLSKLTPRNAKALQSAPDFAVAGAIIYEKLQCASCHIINGAGITLGPALNGLRLRRSKEWVERHFRNPQALSPGTIMPAYEFSRADMEKIISYLFVLSE